MATEAELLAYGRKMLERGDSWRSVRSYLTKKLSDDSQINEIIQTLSELERNGHIVVVQDVSKSRKKTWNIIIGLSLMGLGVFLFSFLWYSGWIATLPLIIFVAGLVVLNGGNPVSLFRPL